MYTLRSPHARRYALATSLRSLAGEPGRARAMGLAARARVEAHFTIERMVQDYANVYRDVSGPRN